MPVDLLQQPVAARSGAAAWRRASLALALVLAGCAAVPDVAPSHALRDAASVGLDPVAAGADAGAPDALWWRGLGDAQLDDLVSQALQGNPGLKMAQARLARAEAAMGVAAAARQPQVSAGLDLMHQRYTAMGAVPPPLAGSVRDSGTLQLSAGWEPDFFGRNQAALDAALGNVRSAQADAQAARVLLSASVVRAYAALARWNALLVLARRSLAQREETLALVRERVEAGLDTRLELLQSSAGLPEARQQIEAAQEQIALGRNALAALVGQPQMAPAIVMPQLAGLRQPALATTIPADLLGRRADIVAARWRVEAAGSEVAQARAQFYPNVNLVAFAGLSSIGLERLLESGSLQWGVGPAVRLPLFDAGRLRANLGVRSADLDAAIESYNAAVIDALRDVADQLASGRSIALQRAQQGAALAAAQGAYEIALQRYRAGLGNYLFVLAAESMVLNQRRVDVDLAARALDTHVALVRALGGGVYSQAAKTP